MNSIVFPSTKTKILEGPIKSSNDLVWIYQPVECDFTDELEFASVKKINVEVKYWNSLGELADSTGRIVDIFTKNKEEFLTMTDSSHIRLDRIFQIRIVDE